MAKSMIGIIGGSGLYDIDWLNVLETRAIKTPYSDPSDKFTIGEFHGSKVVFLPRHGAGHIYSPNRGQLPC